MVSTRRNFTEIAARGAACLPAIASAAAQEAQAPAQGVYSARPGDGGYGREVKALPPGGAVAFHDPGDVAMSDFRFALDAEKPRSDRRERDQQFRSRRHLVFRQGPRPSPAYLLANNFAGVPQDTIARLKRG